MMRTVHIWLIALMTGYGCSHSFGQDSKTTKQWFEKHTVDFTLGNFSVGMPFKRVVINKFYPSATIGTAFYYSCRQHTQIYQAASFGGYYSKYSTSSFFLNTDIGYRYTLGFGLFADAGIGIGYSHLFRPNAIYKMNESGEYQQVRDWGRSSFMADYSLSIGYDFSKRMHKHVSAFLRYGNYVQLFYNPDIPALPQNSLQIGIRLSACQKQKSDEKK